MVKKLLLLSMVLFSAQSVFSMDPEPTTEKDWAKQAKERSRNIQRRLGELRQLHGNNNQPQIHQNNNNQNNEIQENRPLTKEQVLELNRNRKPFNFKKKRNSWETNKKFSKKDFDDSDSDSDSGSDE